MEPGAHQAGRNIDGRAICPGPRADHVGDQKDRLSQTQKVGAQ